jgi:hypothetical protein
MTGGKRGESALVPVPTKRQEEERTSAFEDSEQDSHREELAEVLDPRRADSDDSEAEAELQREQREHWQSLEESKWRLTTASHREPTRFKIRFEGTSETM